MYSLLLALSLWNASAADSVHARHEAEALGATTALRAGPARLPDATPGPDAVVYGYQAYWNADLAAVPWDELSHLAIFSAGATPTGGLTETSRWDIADDAVAIAEAYDVRVHLCVTNFDPSELSTLLGSASARQALIEELVDWKEATGAHGVNVDFEGLPAGSRDEMVQFTRDLEAAVGEVVLATPAVDWSGAWDYSELSRHADLFIMGYAYHWAGSDFAGPNDPLHGGSPWSAYALDWTVQDYLDHDADPERVILGLPLYGFSWPVVSGSVPAATTGQGSSVIWSTAQARAATHGRRFEPASRTPYWYDGSHQGWYGDTASLRERVAHALDAGLGGIGFWALHYDGGDAELWSMVREETTAPADPGDEPDPDDEEPVPDDRFVADAGPPFLAYPRDTVVLSGALSEGPGELVYRWTQVAGPEVTLDDPSAMEPSFRVRDPATHVFELEVGDGEAWSEPARSHVVVLDRKAGARYLTCGCATGPGLPVLFPLLLPLAYIRLRQARARREEPASRR